MKEKESITQQEKTLDSYSKKLILFNDDEHTFDFVIESLIEVCGHDPVTAEQCTMIVHYKGRCDVKSGSHDYLIPFRNGLDSLGLIVAIE
ncbi:MAG: ATP-dependent Clp protease adaptor ClpS [Bacteroidota bacterium]